MANNANLVTAGQPKIGGAVFWAPLGSTLPTTAVADLAAAYVCLGYVSEDGVTFNRSRETEDVTAWGGDKVLTLQTEKTDTAQMTLIEALNENVLKLVHGSGNVSGALATGLTVKETAEELDYGVWIIDAVLNGDVSMRTVLPNAKITTIDDIKFASNEAVGYNVTVAAYPYSEGSWNGETHIEYYKASSSGTSGTSGTSGAGH